MSQQHRFESKVIDGLIVILLIIGVIVLTPLMVSPLVFETIRMLFLSGANMSSDYWQWVTQASGEAQTFVTTIAYLLMAIVSTTAWWVMGMLRIRAEQPLPI